jgi:pimeloyl-ACP methyl ester carboxylesterase
MGNSLSEVIQGKAFPVPFPRTPLDPEENYHWVKTRNGLSTYLLYLPCPGARYTLIYSHGNASDLGQLNDYMYYLRDKLRVSVVGYEYLGYGYTDGRPSERKCYDSLEAVYGYVHNKLRVPEGRLIFFGHSLGTGISMEMASRESHRDCGGLILSAPLLSAIKVYCESSICRDVLSSIDFLESDRKAHLVRCPVLILHGEEDKVVSVEHGKHLYNVMRSRHGGRRCTGVWLSGMGHDRMEYDRRYLGAIRKFLGKLDRIM